jgi:hypothetical protein
MIIPIRFGLIDWLSSDWSSDWCWRRTCSAVIVLDCLIFFWSLIAIDDFVLFGSFRIELYHEYNVQFFHEILPHSVRTITFHYYYYYYYYHWFVILVLKILILIKTLPHPILTPPKKINIITVGDVSRFMIQCAHVDW